MLFNKKRIKIIRVVILGGIFPETERCVMKASLKNLYDKYSYVMKTVLMLFVMMIILYTPV